MGTLLAHVAVLVILISGSAAADLERSPVSESHPWRQDLDCTGAIPLGIGAYTSGDNTGLPNNVTSYPPCWGAPLYLQGGEIVYEITIDGPECRSFGANLTGQSDNLRLYLLGSCDEHDCVEDGTALVTDCLAPGTYYLVVDGWISYYQLRTYDWNPEPHCCPVLDACYVFDFNASSAGLVTELCGGTAVWEWGETDEEIPTLDCAGGEITNILGTVLTGNYLNNAGQIVRLGPVAITVDCACLELCHYYDIEEDDGGSVKISTDGGSTWDTIFPQSNYDGFTKTFPSDEAAMCLAGEPVFTDTPPFEFQWDCFDLSPYIGESVTVGLFFGANESTTSRGWYIKSVRIGDPDSPVERRSWGAIKGLYR